MKTLLGCVCAAVAVGLLVLVAAGQADEEPTPPDKVQKGEQKAKEDDGFARDFRLEKDELSPTGRNAFFVLEPGYYLALEKGAERVTITVLGETKKVGDVTTRVIEERETKNGKLVEVSRNYFAISTRTKDVYYFGETVDDYKDGKVVGHSGAWLSGEKGARFGLMMPGTVRLGFKHYQEIAPGVALDRAEIVSLTEVLETPAGKFKDCLKVEETTPLEPGQKGYKVYAPGVGLIRDGSLVLAKYGFGEKPKE